MAKGTFTPSGQLNASWIIMVITVIGTTIAPWMQFYQQASVVDKGLDKKDLVFERIDTAVGNVFLFIAGLVEEGGGAADDDRKSSDEQKYVSNASVDPLETRSFLSRPLSTTDAC